jgi:hypothetical protein
MPTGRAKEWSRCVPSVHKGINTYSSIDILVVNRTRYERTQPKFSTHHVMTRNRQRLCQQVSPRRTNASTCHKKTAAPSKTCQTPHTVKWQASKTACAVRTWVPDERFEIRGGSRCHDVREVLVPEVLGYSWRKP